MLDQNLVLKSDELFLAGNIRGQQSGELAAGLYARDTRHLSRFHVTLDGTELTTLSARPLSATNADVMMTNPPLTLSSGQLVPPQTISVEEKIELTGGASVDIEIGNYSGQNLSVTLAIELAADFRDLFAIRGFPSPPTGQDLPPETTPQRVELGYTASDDLTARTTIDFNRPGQMTVLGPHSTLPEVDPPPGLVNPPKRVIAAFPLQLGQGEQWQLNIRIDLQPACGGPLADVIMTPASLGMARVRSNDAFFNQFVARSLSDLAMLQTSFPQGSLPAAGIPWYVAPFGRDSLITALQTLHLSPRIAIGTLRVLAAHQGTTEDAWREEQPGKILHEVRQGELARLKQIPHTPYLGSIDATPLFALLFAETVAWTGSEALYCELLPNARRAIEWIERYGDADGDCFVEYAAETTDSTQIANQGWKDSFDSLNHVNGQPASGEIALVEVQGYVYAAYRRLAAVTRQFGNHGWADELDSRADAIQAAVERHFWLDDAGFYAQALDHDKRPVAAISSNPGHLLYCQLPSAERADRLVKRFLEPDLDSGWGIRTLSSEAVTYNPMSYHNGSVWPHDNSLLIAGMRRYGYVTETNGLIRQLLDAALTQPLVRLPELFCGFARSQDSTNRAAPVDYPVSCSPQAWAAGTAPLLVRAILGLEIDSDRQCLMVDPVLPPWLSSLALRQMQVLGEDASLEVRREGDDYEVKWTGPIERARAPMRQYAGLHW